MARTIAKDHDDKRLKLLRSAASVFAEQGIARASMSQIAKDCGISKANIYHYYDSKESLLFDILDAYLKSLRDRLCDLPLDALTPEDGLRRLVGETLLAYEGMDHEHKIQAEVIPMLPPEQQNVLKSYQRDIVARMSDVLCRIEPDVFSDDPAKLKAATMAVFGMLNWFYMWNSTADTAARENYARIVSEMTMNGLKGL